MGFPGTVLDGRVRGTERRGLTRLALVMARIGTALLLRRLRRIHFQFTSAGENV